MGLAEIPTRQSPVALVCPQDRGSIAEDPAHHADLPWLESWRSHSGAMSKRAWYPTAPSWLRPRHTWPPQPNPRRLFRASGPSRVRERGDGLLEDTIGVSRAGKKCDPVSSIVCTVHAGLWQAVMELPDIS